MSEEPSDRRSASALPRSRVPLWAMVLAGCGCAGILAPVVLAWLLVPVIHKATADAREQLCVSNVKTLALGFRMYAADYDGCLPIADMWTDATAPYVGHQGVLACPSANAMERDELGYAFNSHLGAKKLARWATPATVVLLFDSSSLERNAADAVTSLPVPGRHRGKDTVGFLDGHAALTDPARVTLVQASGKGG